MIRPVDLSDTISRTPIVERLQQSDKNTAEGNQKYLQVFLHHLDQKRIETSQPTNQDEHVQDATKQHSSGQDSPEQREKPAGENDDQDEKEMTHLGLKIDVVA